MSVIKKLEIQKKGILQNDVNAISYIFGIVIKEEGESYSPVYPYVRSKDDLENLKTFCTVYRDYLLEFYKNGHNRDFSIFLFGVGGTKRKMFLEEWFEKGVMIT